MKKIIKIIRKLNHIKNLGNIDTRIKINHLNKDLFKIIEIILKKWYSLCK